MIVSPDRLKWDYPAKAGANDTDEWIEVVEHLRSKAEDIDNFFKAV